MALSAVALGGAGDVAVGVGARLCAVAVVAIVAATVLAWPSLVPAALVLVGAAYATRLAVDDVALDVRAPLVAAGLAATAELAYWSLEERENVRGEPGEGLRRLGLVGVLALATLGVGTVLVAITDTARVEGLALDVLGAAAAAGVLLLVVLAARSSARS